MHTFQVKNSFKKVVLSKTRSEQKPVKREEVFVEIPFFRRKIKNRCNEARANKNKQLKF